MTAAIEVRSDPDATEWCVYLCDGGESELLDTAADRDDAISSARHEALARMLPIYERDDGELSLVEDAPQDVPDGEYYIFSAGSCWRYEAWRGGSCVASTYEADMDSHRAAGDGYKNCDPSAATDDVPMSVQRSIVGPDAYLDCVYVMRVPAEGSQWA